jgi:polyvinyl alcohol dehydrogenase (cytochrome)
MQRDSSSGSWRGLAGVVALAAGLAPAGCAGSRVAPVPPPDLRLEGREGLVFGTAEQLFQARCATCHGGETGTGPALAVLASRTRESIIATLTSGAMQSMATGLSQQQIADLAALLSATPAADGAEAAAVTGFCEAPGGPIDLESPQWNGWGRDLDNSRFQPDPGLRPEDVPRLRVKWAFRYDGGSLFGQPVVVGDRLFVGNLPGDVYSLDAASGCVHWRFSVPGGVRATVSVGRLPDGRLAVYAGDDRSIVYGIDAMTGAALWSTRVDTHERSRITGSPVLYNGVLYVPVSSLEESGASSDEYICCRFRGSVAALDAATGHLIWQTYPIAEEPRPYRTNRVGNAVWGPAGAAIWSSPTIDPRRGVLYVATGNSYTDVPEPGSSAVLAMALETGQVRWTSRVFESDNYISTACGPGRGPANCPEGESGPDFDFGASPVLRTLPDGRQLLIAGNKGAFLYAMDPDNRGAIVWQTRLGAGSALGGIQWGFAADDQLVYVAVADMLGSNPARRPGVHAVRIATGETVWYSPAPPPACSWPATFACSNATSGAVTLIPGVAFAGSLDGHLRAFDAATGSLVWGFDTARLYEAVNGGLARGGSLDSGGATVVNGMLFINSGYGRHTRRQAGNALLAFTVDGR